MSWHSEYFLKKEWRRGRFVVGISWRSGKSAMGRFGGGWQWKIGLQGSSSTVIVSLLILEVRISWYKPE